MLFTKLWNVLFLDQELILYRYPSLFFLYLGLRLHFSNRIGMKFGRSVLQVNMIDWQSRIFDMIPHFCHTFKMAAMTLFLIRSPLAVVYSAVSHWPANCMCHQFLIHQLQTGWWLPLDPPPLARLISSSEMRWWYWKSHRPERRLATNPLPSMDHVSGTVYRRQFVTQHYQLLSFSNRLETHLFVQ